jgi:DNA replication and repair protein RecF
LGDFSILKAKNSTANQPMSITKIVLNNYRSYKEFELSQLPKFIILAGQNGVGKTNLLESISLLTPGKGLRGAAADQVQHNQNNNPWTIYSEFADGNHISASTCSKTRRKIIRLNASNLRSHSEILEVLRVIWLTPQMEDVISESNTQKRKFIDRLTYNFFPAHAALIINYEKLMRSRLKLLKGNVFDDIWLSQLELQMANLSKDISQNRLRCIELLSESLSTFVTAFLKPTLSLNGFIEQNLTLPNLPQVIAAKLKEARFKDSRAQRTTFGCHKSEIVFTHPSKNINSNLCSTGEQKAMLISLTLAQVKKIKSLFNGNIILLLDDIFSHLDDRRKKELIDEIEQLDVQCWISTTEQSINVKDALVYQY